MSLISELVVKLYNFTELNGGWDQTPYWSNFQGKKEVLCEIIESTD